MNRIHTLLTCTGLVTLWFIIRDDTPGAVAQQQSEPVAVALRQDVRDVDTKGQEAILKGFMRMKLNASNQILEGLVVDDLTLVVKGSEALLKMSAAEKWRASNDMMYLQRSRDFRQSVELLRNKAKKASIDGAALAWVDVTMSCIQCHEWVRNVLVADLSAELTPTSKGKKDRTDIAAETNVAQ
ncbi:MAG: hypothetical protein GY903_15340 [Fuerstiella sp.]|nr:hypothetical protein [Fuerstiella sp.]MCP4855855.1 hypothetical protein [Fuerstiella sp.]